MSVTFKNETVAKHRALADKIKAGCKAEGTQIKENESHSAYNGNLPNGWTAEDIKTLSMYNLDFNKASHVAVGEMSADMFNADSELKKVQAKVGYFAAADSLIFSVERSRTYNNSLAAAGEPTKVTKNLVISCDEDIRGTGLKSLKDAMSLEFKDSFCK